VRALPGARQNRWIHDGIGANGRRRHNSLGQQAESLAGKMQEVRAEIFQRRLWPGRVVDACDRAARGSHVLLEGAPGLGKTLLVRTLAQAVALVFTDSVYA